jgi:DNA helicase-2/ATP-dependent DNA helicase PcrA
MKEYVLKPSTDRKFSIDYAKELNEQQLAVAEAGGGPLLVIAGAGSGKTRTLTYRVARLIELGNNPSGLMLLTFTNKAAREMLDRVSRLLPNVNMRQAYGGTFHHVGNIILRRFGSLVGLRDNYTILDREDSKDLLDDVAEKFHERNKRFPRGDVLLDIHSYAINTGQAEPRVIEQSHPQFQPLMQDILAVLRTYTERKRKLNVVDFDDLLVLWRTALQQHETVLQTHRQMFKHLLVDEYQDTNRLQTDIVELIAGQEGNLMVVGDDAQSIYSFRGANFGNIIDFPKRFPKCKIFKLETNYRSTPEILALANSSIQHNERQFRKMLHAVLPHGPMPEFVRCDDERQQAAFIVDRIQAMHQEGINLSDIAILYRAHYHSLEVQMELQAAGIPFEVRSGMRFFEQAHIKDVTAYLKIAVNDKDEMAWKRILKLIPRVGPKTAARLWETVSAAPSAIDALGAIRELPKGSVEAFRELYQLLNRLRSDEFQRAPAEAIKTVLETSYKNYLIMTYANAPVRVDDIRRLSDFALRFDSCQSLLAELALAANVQADDQVVEPDKDDVLVLSTIHQAKGLEWKAVFLIWLIEGKFPDTRSVMDEDGLEEERRLFYVASTRAKAQLYLTMPMAAFDRGFQILTRPSRFIGELDPGTYDEVRVSSE